MSKDTIKKACAVLRVSSAAQGEQADKTSIPDQLERAQQWCADEGWELVSVFDETAEKGWQSGAVEMNDRPYIQQMLDAARAGEFDVVLFRDNTRLGRDKLEAQGLANDLRRAGVPLVGFTYDRRVLNVVDSMDGMLFDMGQTQAQMDYTQIKRNLMGGRFRNAKRGLHSIGPVHLGYRRITEGPDKGKLEIVEEEADVIRAGFHFIAGGMSADAAAKQLNDRGYPYFSKQGGKKWLGSHIRWWLQQPALMGAGFIRNMSPGPGMPKEEIVVPAPAILTEKEWADAQRAYGKTQRSYFGNGRAAKRDEWKFYALSANGKKDASYAFHVHPDGEEVPLYQHTRKERSGKVFRRYICQHRLRDERLRGGNPLCDGFSHGYIKGGGTQVTINAAPLEAQVLLTLLEAASDPEVMKEMVEETDRRATQAQSLKVTVDEANQKLKDIETDREQVIMVARVAKKPEQWLVDELQKLDVAEAKARQVLLRASKAQEAVDQIEEAHETIVAVFHADRDANGYVTVKLPGGKKGKVFLPDTDTPEGLRQMAEAVLSGKMHDLPVQVRYALRWLVETLEAKVLIHETTQDEAPVITVELVAVQQSKHVHKTAPLHRKPTIALPVRWAA